MDAELEMATGLDMETGPDIGLELTVGNRTRRNFEALVLPQLDNLYIIALLVLDDESDASNLAQDSFVTAYERWYDKPFEPDYRVWLYKIMVNILSIKYCPLVKQSTHLTDADTIDVYRIYTRWVKKQGIDISDQVPMPESSRDDIRKAIISLPCDFRLLLVLSLLADFSYQEISEIVGVDREIIRIKLHQGRKLIQRSIFYRNVSMEDADFANCKEN